VAKKNLFVFRICLKDSKPRIWRKLQVPGNFTLGQLHQALQIAFGWTNSYLHSFTIDEVEYRMAPEPGMDLYDDDALCEDDYRLDDLGLWEKQGFSYLYDFGDSWEHGITVFQILPFDEDQAAPRCLGGKYAGPPEDCGGIRGYAEMLEILKDPQHKDYQDTLDWAGDVDPLAFDLGEINGYLKKAFTPAPKTKAGGVKAAKGKAGKKRGVPDGKLKKLYTLMDRVKELKPWEKLWDTELILIEFPGREEPTLCSVMGRGGENYGILVHSGYESILSFLRMLDEESDNPFVTLGCQNCLICQLGGREDLFPEERARLKELGISFRGRLDWVSFRKVRPGCPPWHIDSKDADILIEVLERFIEACGAYAEGLAVNFDDGEVLVHRYSKRDKKWISAPGKLPRIPMTMHEFHVDSGEIEPLRLKKQLKNTVELATLFFPQTLGVNEEGFPVLVRANILIDNKSGVVLDQIFLDADEDGERKMLEMLINFIADQGRPETVLVRDKFAAAVLGDLCGKIGIDLVHSQGLPRLDEFVHDLPGLLKPLDFSG
jgi:hypothetical protein